MDGSHSGSGREVRFCRGRSDAGGEQSSAFAVKRLESILNHLDLMGFEQRFAALGTHPRRIQQIVRVRLNHSARHFEDR